MPRAGRNSSCNAARPGRRSSPAPTCSRAARECFEEAGILLAHHEASAPAAAEAFWRAHLEHMRDLVMSAYEAPMTIDVLNEPIGKLRPVRNVRRQARPAGKATDAQRNS